MHEAFLRAMLHEDTLSTLKEQQSRSWLYRTVKNLYVDRLRHGKKEIILDEFSQPQIDSEELVRLEWEKLLETLPDLEGVIFSLRYLEEMCIRDRIISWKYIVIDSINHVVELA